MTASEDQEYMAAADASALPAAEPTGAARDDAEQLWTWAPASTPHEVLRHAPTLFGVLVGRRREALGLLALASRDYRKHGLDQRRAALDALANIDTAFDELTMMVKALGQASSTSTDEGSGAGDG